MSVNPSGIQILPGVNTKKHQWVILETFLTVLSCDQIAEYISPAATSILIHGTHTYTSELEDLGV